MNEHHTDGPIGWTMLALSMIFISAFAWLAAGEEYGWATVCAAGAIGFAMLARSEWKYEDRS